MAVVVLFPACNWELQMFRTLNLMEEPAGDQLVSPSDICLTHRGEGMEPCDVQSKGLSWQRSAESGSTIHLTFQK